MTLGSAKTSGQFKVTSSSRRIEPKEESVPIALKKIDITRTTHTSLDVMQEKRRNDYWNVDVDRTFSDS